MSVTPISSGTPAATGAAVTGAAAASAQLAGTYDSFLKLLTTQLKHQNPLDPLDSNQFVQQLVGFAGVEQQIASNANLEKLISLQNNGVETTALGYIGKTVEATGDTASLGADGTAQYTYTLPKTAALATVGIVDGLGRVVYSAPASIAQGEHGFTWDGKDANGNSLPPGDYRIRVAAVDATGASITATTSIIGRVTAVEPGDGGPTLVLGATRVPAASVTAVRESTL
jgi:flagellar basal-body rod modification protein FlgD